MYVCMYVCMYVNIYVSKMYIRYVCNYVCMYVVLIVGQVGITSGQHLTKRSLIPSKESIAGTPLVFQMTTLTSNIWVGGSATSSGG